MCGRESWAAESGTNGMAFWTWNDGGYGGFGQDVPLSAAKGDLIEFSIRGQAEENFVSTKAETWIKVEYWHDSSLVTQYTRDVYALLTSHPGQWCTCSLVSTNPANDINLVKIIVGGGGFKKTATPQAVKWDNASLVNHGPSAKVVPIVHGQTLSLEWNACTDCYYRVWIATRPGGPWREVRGMKLGRHGLLSWSDGSSIQQYDHLFYRVEVLPLQHPHDYDEDGLDDVSELQNGNSDPTDPDSDGDTIPDGNDPRPSVPNEAPSLDSVTAGSSDNFHDNGEVTFTVQSTDPDGDTVEFRYSTDGGAFSTWQSSGTLEWVPSPRDSGREHDIIIEVRDPWNATNTTSTAVFIYRTPPHP